MSADNGVWIAEIDGEWWVYYGFASEEFTRATFRAHGNSYPSKDAAILAAHEIANDVDILEYGVSVITLPEPCPTCGR